MDFAGVTAQFDNHPVHGRLSEILAEFSRLDREPAGELTPVADEYLRASRYVFDRARLRLSAQDKLLVTQTTLKAIEVAADDVLSAIRSFWSSPSDAVAERLHAAAGQLLNSQAGFTTTTSTRRGQINTATAEAVRAEVQASTMQLRTLVSEATTAHANVTNVISGALVDLDRRASEASVSLQQIQQGIEDRSSQIEKHISEISDELTIAAEQLERQRTLAISDINQALQGIESRFGESETSRTARFLEAETERASQFNVSVTEARSSHLTLVGELEALRRAADEVLQLAGGAALSHRWIAQARIQLIERILWLSVLALLSIGSVAFTFWQLDHFTAPADSSLVAAIVFYFPRLPLAIITVTVIAFIAKQSARRGLWEARDRRVANELTALPAFLATLSPEVQQALATKVADRYFPGPQVSHDDVAGSDRVETTIGPGPMGGLYALIGSVTTSIGLVAALVIALVGS